LAKDFFFDNVNLRSLSLDFALQALCGLDLRAPDPAEAGERWVPAAPELAPPGDFLLALFGGSARGEAPAPADDDLFGEQAPPGDFLLALFGVLVRGEVPAPADDDLIGDLNGEGMLWVS
jgi:hypothetical protein